MRVRRSDVLILVLLFALPLVLFWPQTVGGRTLLPAENLYQFQPYAAYREALGVPLPHNALLSDLVLENLQWKTFIRAELAAGEAPLWNPHQFSGIPFLAAGQHSALYPFSLIYYVLPLPAAYGWFTVAQLFLAGAFMFVFLRGLGIGQAGGAVGAVTYQLAAFFVISAVFPMIIAAAAWLPLILLMIEFIITRRPAFRGRPAAAVWTAVGALALGSCVLAGHVEITYYTLIISAYYAGVRLIAHAWSGLRTGGAQRQAALALAFRSGLWLVGMVVLGIGLGAVQFIPLFELASINFRSGSATLEDVRGWAHPLRDAIQFALPNVYGSPAAHGFFDVFAGQWVSLDAVPLTNALGQPFRTIDWGVKNYVEGALYLGLLPLALAIIGLTAGARRIHRALFGALGALALTFMFGLPTYALLFLLPGINQLHSPFRWVFALTLCAAALAGFGMDALIRGHGRRPGRALAGLFAAAGGLALLGLLIVRAAFPTFEALFDSLVERLALADGAFSDGRMFFSYQFGVILAFGVMALGAGAVLYALCREPQSEDTQRLTPVRLAAIGLIALDLMVASWGFNPASDPAWLDFKPPAIAWLEEQPGDWRYITLNDPTAPAPDLFQANMTMRYGIDDVRGYESIIPRQYVAFMEQLAPQVQLEFNRIAPLYTVYPESVPFDAREALESPLLDLLNVRYVITHTTTDLADVDGYALVYEDESARIWENSDYFPRAFILSQPAADDDPPPEQPTEGVPLERLNNREMAAEISVAAGAQLIVLETHLPGWRAFIRPADHSETEPQDERALETARVFGNFIGVTLPEAGAWTVRLIYSPQSFSIGLFGSVVAVLIVLLLIGGALWRAYLTPLADEAESADLNRVMRNSLAPIALNLFNRGIDFVFAFVMLRVLGPEGMGAYSYAVVVFIWFDILTNFGLNLYLTRAVARDRSRARALFIGTSRFRLLLAALGVPLLLGFLSVRQSAISPPLDTATIIALGLLYIGLIPNSLSTGLTALYYGFERAEMPAAVATAASINKAVFGLIALLGGAGIVGLAGVSILTNLLTLALLLWFGRDMLRRADGREMTSTDAAATVREMARESWPLMINHLLATIFFQIDVIIIEAIHGARMVGQYSVAYKWLSALNVIPAFFTQAMLPVMSRQAHGQRDALRRNTILSLKLLFSLTLPIAIIFTFAAEFLVGILGGAAYLPDSAIATQLMIWSIPIGWMNSLIQYVLVALDLQRRITLAFIAAVTFNVVTNMLFVPAYGYQAAAITTILSEMVLLIPFALLLHGAVGRLPWVAMLWRPAAAGIAMLSVMLPLWEINGLVAIAAGSAVYTALWIMLRALSAEEWARLLPLIPMRARGMVARVSTASGGH